MPPSDRDAGREAAFAETRIPNRVDALRPMSAWLDDALRRAQAPEPMRFAFDFCANEAVANIVGHAFPEGGAHEIALRLFVDARSIALEIEDDGVAYDPLARPEHEPPASLEAAPIGGLGVHLIRRFTDRCGYARRGGSNVLTLVAERARPGAGPPAGTPAPPGAS
jgi:anti-sigma regulatory factor (Ser/Thr protein kinase)